MNFLTVFTMAFRAITTNKMRSFLTMLGVIIGVSSVVMLIAIGKGLEDYITEQFESLGSNNIFISPGEVFNDSGGFNQESSEISAMNIKFTLKEIKNLQKLKNRYQYLAYYSAQIDDLSFLTNETSATILGTSADYPLVLKTELSAGRFYSAAEADQGEKIVVLGWELANDLFGQVSPIGKKINCGSHQFTVIGVATKKGGGMGGPSFDNYAYIPFETLARLYDDDKIMSIVLKTRTATEIPTMITAIEKIMLDDFEEDEFSVFDQSEILGTINSILGIVTTALGGIAAISLVVGGIGIMNIMLVSVTERTREIGLRKALGATPNQILTQFLIEAAVLSLTGGLIGLGLASLGALAIQSVFPAKITLEAIALSFGVSTIVGLIFGVAPAKKAASLSPIEALRYE